MRAGTSCPRGGRRQTKRSFPAIDAQARRRRRSSLLHRPVFTVLNGGTAALAFKEEGHLVSGGDDARAAPVLGAEAARLEEACNICGIGSALEDHAASFHAARAPEGMGLDDLTVLGPIFVLKVRLTPEEFDRRRIVAEMWLYPDGSRLLELSTKCLPAEAFEVAAEVRAFLCGHGVDISGDQQPKTKKALDYFAGIARREDG